MNTYHLLDSGNGEKLERVGPYLLRRPALAATWQPRLAIGAWQKADAHFLRHAAANSSDADTTGAWQIANQTLRDAWQINFEQLTLQVRLSEMGQLGFFAEQRPNWQALSQAVRALQARIGANLEPIKVLNLFAYTGGSTLACAGAGAHVVHVDAAKASVSWARANAELSGLSQAPIRWIVDDAQDFVAREIRRGANYHGIVLDPPSFGRGTNGQPWQINLHLPRLLTQLQRLIDPRCGFLLLSAHSPGYTARALSDQLAMAAAEFGASRDAGAINVHASNHATIDDGSEQHVTQSHYDLVVNEDAPIEALPTDDRSPAMRAIPSGACAWHRW